MPGPRLLIVVFGATGMQGGSVVSSLLAHPAQFRVRAVTRDVSKASARALAERGCEVVAADLNDKAQVRAALKGAYGVFSVTNFWERADPAVEIAQGCNVADAAVDAGVQHLIWSSLINVSEVSKGVLTHVSHFDSKAAVAAHIRTLPLRASFLRPGFYMSNLPTFLRRTSPPAAPPAYTLALPIPPSAPIPLFDAGRDMGKFAVAIFRLGEKAAGREFNAASAYVTPAQLVAEWSAVTGVRAEAVQVPGEVWKAGLMGTGMPEAGAEDLLQNMRLMDEFGYFGGEGLEESQAILEEPLTTWREFVQKEPTWKDL